MFFHNFVKAAAHAFADIGSHPFSIVKKPFGLFLQTHPQTNNQKIRGKSF